MILGPLWGIPLGFFVAEDICEGPILVRDSFIHLYSSNDCLSSFCLGGEYCFVGIIASYDDGELGIVNPSLSPINPWLGASEPGVPKNHMIFA